MYAVIETGGKQYRVEVGTELEVELLDVEPGKTITIERVLLVADGDEAAIGRPVVADAEVSAEVVRQTRGPKLISFKYRPKARSRVKKGHRQELTVLRISDITFGGKSAAEGRREGPARREDRARAARRGRRRPGRQGRRARRQARGRHRGRPDQGGTEEDHGQGRGEGRRQAARAAKPAAKPAAKKAEATADAPKTTKATPAKADAADAKPAAPKRPRATKKDE